VEDGAGVEAGVEADRVGFNGNCYRRVFPHVRGLKNKFCEILLVLKSLCPNGPERVINDERCVHK